MPAEIFIQLLIWFLAGMIPALARNAVDNQGWMPATANSILSGCVGVIGAGLLYDADAATFQLMPMLISLAIGVGGDQIWGGVLTRILGNGGPKK